MSFDNVDYTKLKLPIFILYFDHKDHRGKWVVRLFDLDKPTPLFIVAGSQKEAVAHIPPQYRNWLSRSEGDERQIVAVFL